MEQRPPTEAYLARLGTDVVLIEPRPEPAQAVVVGQGPVQEWGAVDQGYSVISDRVTQVSEGLQGVRSEPLEFEPSEVMSSAISRQGVIAIATVDGVHVLDNGRRRTIAEPGTRLMSFSVGGKWIAGASEGRIWVRDIRSGRLIVSWNQVRMPKDLLTCERRGLLALSGHWELEIWALRTGTCIHREGTTSPVTREDLVRALNPNAQALVTVEKPSASRTVWAAACIGGTFSVLDALASFAGISAGRPALFVIASLAVALPVIRHYRLLD